MAQKTSTNIYLIAVLRPIQDFYVLTRRLSAFGIRKQNEPGNPMAIRRLLKTFPRRPDGKTP